MQITNTDTRHARTLLIREAGGDRAAANALDSMAINLSLVDRIALDDLATDVAAELRQQRRAKR